MVGLLGHDPCAAFAKTDRCIPVAPAMGAEDRFVAVFEKGARLARMQRQRAAAVHALLAETAPALLARTGDRAAAKQVAGSEVAAAARVVRDKLRQRPIKIERVAVRD